VDSSHPLCSGPPTKMDPVYNVQQILFVAFEYTGADRTVALGSKRLASNIALSNTSSRQGPIWLRAVGANRPYEILFSYFQ